MYESRDRHIINEISNEDQYRLLNVNGTRIGLDEREFVTSSAGRDVRSGQARLARQYPALSFIEGLSDKLRLILDLDLVLGYEHRENGNALRFEEAPVIFVSIKDREGMR